MKGIYILLLFSGVKVVLGQGSTIGTILIDCPAKYRIPGSTCVLREKPTCPQNSVCVSEVGIGIGFCCLSDNLSFETEVTLGRSLNMVTMLVECPAADKIPGTICTLGEWPTCHRNSMCVAGAGTSSGFCCQSDNLSLKVEHQHWSSSLSEGFPGNSPDLGETVRKNGGIALNNQVVGNVLHDNAFVVTGLSLKPGANSAVVSAASNAIAGQEMNTGTKRAQNIIFKNALELQTSINAHSPKPAHLNSPKNNIGHGSANGDMMGNILNLGSDINMALGSGLKQPGPGSATANKGIINLPCESPLKRENGSLVFCDWSVSCENLCYSCEIMDGIPLGLCCPVSMAVCRSRIIELGQSVAFLSNQVNQNSQTSSEKGLSGQSYEQENTFNQRNNTFATRFINAKPTVDSSVFSNSGTSIASTITPPNTLNDTGPLPKNPNTAYDSFTDLSKTDPVLTQSPSNFNSAMDTSLSYSQYEPMLKSIDSNIKKPVGFTEQSIDNSLNFLSGPSRFQMNFQSAQSSMNIPDSFNKKGHDISLSSHSGTASEISSAIPQSIDLPSNISTHLTKEYLDYFLNGQPRQISLPLQSLDTHSLLPPINIPDPSTKQSIDNSINNGPQSETTSSFNKSLQSVDSLIDTILNLTRNYIGSSIDSQTVPAPVPVNLNSKRPPPVNPAMTSLTKESLNNSPNYIHRPSELPLTTESPKADASTMPASLATESFNIALNSSSVGIPLSSKATDPLTTAMPLNIPERPIKEPLTKFDKSINSRPELGPISLNDQGPPPVDAFKNIPGSFLQSSLDSSVNNQSVSFSHDFQGPQSVISSSKGLSDRLTRKPLPDKSQSSTRKSFDTSLKLYREPAPRKVISRDPQPMDALIDIPASFPSKTLDNTLNRHSLATVNIQDQQFIDQSTKIPAGITKQSFETPANSENVLNSSSEPKHSVDRNIHLPYNFNRQSHDGLLSSRHRVASVQFQRPQSLNLLINMPVHSTRQSPRYSGNSRTGSPHVSIVSLGQQDSLTSNVFRRPPTSSAVGRDNKLSDASSSHMRMGPNQSHLVSQSGPFFSHGVINNQINQRSLGPQNIAVPSSGVRLHVQRDRPRKIATRLQDININKNGNYLSQRIYNTRNEINTNQGLSIPHRRPASFPTRTVRRISGPGSIYRHSNGQRTVSYTYARHPPSRHRIIHTMRPNPVMNLQSTWYPAQAHRAQRDPAEIAQSQFRSRLLPHFTSSQGSFIPHASAQTRAHGVGRYRLSHAFK